MRDGTPVYASAAAAPFLDAVLAGGGMPPGGYTVITSSRSFGSGRRAVRVAPVDLADVPGSLMLYVPSARWVFASDATTPLDLMLVRERARALGWEVEALGTARHLWIPLNADE